MNTAEWIIAGILSFALLIFLIIGIVVLFKVLDLTRDAKHLLRELNKLTKKSHNIVDKASDAVDIAKDDLTATTSSIKSAVKSAIKQKFTPSNNA